MDRQTSWRESEESNSRAIHCKRCLRAVFCVVRHWIRFHLRLTGQQNRRL